MTCYIVQDPLAGIIPRSVFHLFEKLESQVRESCRRERESCRRERDYYIKLSFLELYNEELIDLL